MCKHRGPLRAPTPAPGLSLQPSSGEEARPLPRNVPTPEESVRVPQSPFLPGPGRAGVLQPDPSPCPKAEARQGKHPEWVGSLCGGPTQTEIAGPLCEAAWGREDGVLWASALTRPPPPDLLTLVKAFTEIRGGEEED